MLHSAPLRPLPDMHAEGGRPAAADWLQAACVGLALTALYAATTATGVLGEDDGFFILSGYFLGIEHPPGYPVHTLLGKCMSLLPFGTVAWRLHLLSGLLGGATGAAVWLCARRLSESRLAAYLAALGLGLSPAFWSQSIIAEVYTLNTLFTFALLGLVLQQRRTDSPGGRRMIALTYGLSLANHWPLMVLVTPAFLIPLWARRRQFAREWYVLLPFLLAGLLPYAWMVARSWHDQVVSFYGPIESLSEFWFFLSRAGYAAADASPTADWIDRARYFGFAAVELVRQFSVVGALLVALGSWVQWRSLGTAWSWALTLGFLGPSAALLCLLGFDYDALHKHIFHVYPLPAYGIAALWMGLGFSWSVRRLRSRRWIPMAAALGLILTIGVHGARANVVEDLDWTARYARTVLGSLPSDAVVITQGDVDLAPLAYYHLVENWRPDVTLVQRQGLILGNRLFHPLRTSDAEAAERLRGLVDSASGPVVFTRPFGLKYPLQDHWLFATVDRTAGNPDRITSDVSEDLIRFFEDEVLDATAAQGWTRFIQNDLRRKFGRLIGRTLPVEAQADARTARHLAGLARDFAGSLGVVEGLLSNETGYAIERAEYFLDRARAHRSEDASKKDLARWFELSGYLRLGRRDEVGAVRALEEALQAWPAKANPATVALADLYERKGRHDLVAAMRARLK